MESSATEQQQNEGRRFNSPCTFFKQVIKACLNCLGLHDDHNQHPPPPPPQTEREMKFNEETIMMMATSSARGPIRSRAPNKPHISSGPGGQINYSSSVSSS